MTTRLHLLCHAATAATRANAFAADEALEPKDQARIARLTLPRVDLVLASPARAARETAVALGVEARQDSRLADLDTGRWQGRRLAQVLADEPDAVATWTGDPASAPHGGESIVALVARVGAFLDATAGGPRVLAISHAAVVRAAIVHALGAPPATFWSIDAAPLALAQFSHDGRRWRLRFEGP